MVDGNASKELLISMLQKKQQIWQEAIVSAKHKAECLDLVIHNIQGSQSAERITEMTEEEWAWLLVKMVCVEDVRAQKVLSEALWV